MLEEVVAGLDEALEPKTEMYFEVPSIVSTVIEQSHNQLSALYEFKKITNSEGVMPTSRVFEIEGNLVRYGSFKPYGNSEHSMILMYTHTIYRQSNSTDIDIGFVALFEDPQYLIWSYRSTRKQSFTSRGTFSCKEAHIGDAYLLENLAMTNEIDTYVARINQHLRHEIHAAGDQILSEPAQILPRMIHIVMLGELLAHKKSYHV